MPTIKAKITVSSRSEDAFEYVADWRNFSNYIPMFVQPSVTSMVQYGPGTSLDLTVVLGDKVHMRVELNVVDFQKNRKIVLKSFRGVRTKTTWEFKDVGGKALVALDFEYEVPATLDLSEDEKLALAKAVEAAWVKSLDMLKWAVESGPRDED